MRQKHTFRWIWNLLSSTYSFYFKVFEKLKLVWVLLLNLRLIVMTLSCFFRSFWQAFLLLFWIFRYLSLINSFFFDLIWFLFFLKLKLASWAQRRDALTKAKNVFVCFWKIEQDFLSINLMTERSFCVSKSVNQNILSNFLFLFNKPLYWNIFFIQINSCAL